MNYRWLLYLSPALLFIIQACSFNHFFYDAQRDGDLKYEANPNFHELSVINTTDDTLSGLLLDPGILSKGTILMIHGNSGNITRWTENANYFYNRNYRILVFDYQGYGKSTGKPTHTRTKVPILVRPFVFLTVRSPYKSKNSIEKLHMPVLIAHSKTDKVVPYEMGEELFKRANEPKFFLELQGAHCLGIMNNTEEYFNWIERTFKQQ